MDTFDLNSLIQDKIFQLDTAPVATSKDDMMGFLDLPIDNTDDNDLLGFLDLLTNNTDGTATVSDATAIKFTLGATLSCDSPVPSSLGPAMYPQGDTTINTAIGNCSDTTVPKFGTTASILGLDVAAPTFAQDVGAPTFGHNATVSDYSPDTNAPNLNQAPAMYPEMTEAPADGTVSAFDYLDSILVPQTGFLGTHQQHPAQQDPAHFPQSFPIYGPSTSYGPSTGTAPLDYTMAGLNLDAHNPYGQPLLHSNETPSPAATDIHTPEPEALQSARRVSARGAAKKSKAQATQEPRKKAAPTSRKTAASAAGAKARGPGRPRRVPPPTPPPKVYSLAANVRAHTFFRQLSSLDLERIQVRPTGKQLKEMNLIRAEREGKHFSVPEGYKCTLCARFGYNCLMGKIVDYGHHAEAHIGHCKGCSGNADACTFKKRPEKRIAAYNAYYDGQSFAVFGTLDHGTQVFPYSSINAFTKKHSINETGRPRKGE